MPRPRTHDDALRARLLQRAGAMVAEHGADALGLRGLAAAVNTSTTAVYSLFGGKPELLDALADQVADRFAERLREVPGGDLVGLGMAFRSAALAQPKLYALVTTPGLAALCDAAGEELGRALWATAHGLVELELENRLPDGEFERILRALLTGWPT